MADQETNIEGTETAGHADASNQTSDSQPNVAAEASVAPGPRNSSSTEQGNHATEVAQLLEKIKLPERKEYRASADSLTQRLEVMPAEETPPSSTPQPNARDIVSAVHTLKDDFQSAVQDQKISLVQAAALQEEKRVRHTQDSTVRTVQKKNSYKMLVTILTLLGLGTIAFGASVLLIRDRANVEPSTFLVEGLLFSEQTVPFPIQHATGADLKRQLSAARTSQGLTLGAITRVAPTISDTAPDGSLQTREATTREFLEALETHVPDELLRAFSDKFFFGFHTVDENAPVMIIPITSYERAFAGMLQWEKTINADLAPFFTGVPSLVRQSDGLLTERVFTDSVMRNFDIRALKDDAGTTQLYYSFPTRSILIIAESPYSFAEILSRLRADRKL